MFKLNQITALANRFAQRALQNRRLLGESLTLLGEMLLHTKGFRWRSDFFRKGAGVDANRTQEIIDAVFYEREARKEIKRAIDRLGGPGGNAFWDLYLRRSVPSVLGFSEEYASLIQLVHSALPEDGTILDWNCSTGQLGAALALAAEKRTLFFADSNPRAIIAAKRLLKSFFPNGNSHIAKNTFPGSDELKRKQFQGAIVSNVLFLLENDAQKIEYLTQAGAVLPVGSPLVLVEPKPMLQKQSVLRLWLNRLANSAARQYSPGSEFDFAMYAEVQRRMFHSVTGSLSTTKQLVEISRQAGFEVTLVRDVLHGHYNALLLRKLPAPKKAEKEIVIRYHDEPYPE